MIRAGSLHHIPAKRQRVEMRPGCETYGKAQTGHSNVISSTGPCRLRELPAELREAIWTFAVTEWTAVEAGRAIGHDSGLREDASDSRMLQQTPIRLDRFNRPLPPDITRVSRQLRHETLHLYYECNCFQLWRPLFWINDWTFSTLIAWLTHLGPKVQWLNDVVLLFKHESELEEHDIEEALLELGFEFNKPGVISNRQELSEFEMSHEAMGLPRHFGRKRRDRWLAGTAS